MDVASITADVRDNWPIYVAMPLIAAFIGYATKLAVVEMLFRPLEFKGKPPLLGWQGLIPRQVPQIVSTAADLVVGRLITPREIIGRVDPEELYRRIGEPLGEAVDSLTRELMLRHEAGLWETLPEPARRLAIHRIKGDVPKIMTRMTGDLREHADEVLDLKALAVRALTRDPARTVALIRAATAPEMRFIARSGPVVGFLLGCVQMAAWALTHSLWVMPLFGAFVGYLTDWLALQMIFRPLEPRRLLGVLRWQGVFHKQREQVSADYARILAEEILTPVNLLEAILTGPASQQVFDAIQAEVDRTVDEQAGLARPLVVLGIGDQRFQEIKKDVVRTALDQIPETTRQIERQLVEALDVHNLIIDKMRRLTAEEYESILRPAFKKEERKVVFAGALLGFLIGMIQSVVVAYLAR